MNYNHLFYFWNIAREGSIKNASVKLHLSQPALSDQLKTLELNIGEKLFYRQGRKLTLSQRGKQVFKYANKMFKIGDELIDALQDKTLKENRIVTIGFVPTIAKGRIYQILLPFLDHPELTIKVIEGEFEFLHRAFEIGDLDIIICENPIYYLDTATIKKKLVESTFYVVCSPHHKEAPSDFPQCLSTIPFLNYTNRSGVQRHIFEYFQQLNIHPNIIGEIDDVNIIRRFTQNGHCYSILPNSVIADYIRDGRLISLARVDKINIAVHAVFRDTIENSLIKEIMETVPSH